MTQSVPRGVMQFIRAIVGFISRLMLVELIKLITLVEKQVNGYVYEINNVK